jgi:hypothetical protein
LDTESDALGVDNSWPPPSCSRRLLRSLSTTLKLKNMISETTNEFENEEEIIRKYPVPVPSRGQATINPRLLGRGGHVAFLLLNPFSLKRETFFNEFVATKQKRELFHRPVNRIFNIMLPVNPDASYQKI